MHHYLRSTNHHFWSMHHHLQAKNCRCWHLGLMYTSSRSPTDRKNKCCHHNGRTNQERIRGQKERCLIRGRVLNCKGSRFLLLYKCKNCSPAGIADLAGTSSSSWLSGELELGLEPRTRSTKEYFITDHLIL